MKASIRKAARDMYPLSSMIAMNRKNSTMMGRKDRMVPMPSNRPSSTKLCTSGGQAVTAGPTASALMRSSIQATPSCKGAPRV